MGRAEERCNDREVKRGADEGWRQKERKMEDKERCHMSFMLRGLDERHTWKQRASSNMFVVECSKTCVFSGVCILV